MEIEGEAEKRSGGVEMKMTPLKKELIGYYLEKFSFEDREYVSDSELNPPDSDSDSEFDGPDPYQTVRTPGVTYPSAHEVAKKFLKQVRESHGYDVDCIPPRCLFSRFVPSNPNPKDDSIMQGLNFAIDRINADTGKHYELVTVEKVVEWHSWLFLTFTVKEGNVLETLRALVEVPFVSTRPLKLDEWMYMPRTPATEASREDVDREIKPAKNDDRSPIYELLAKVVALLGIHSQNTIVKLVSGIVLAYLYDALFNWLLTRLPSSSGDLLFKDKVTN